MECSLAPRTRPGWFIAGTVDGLMETAFSDSLASASPQMFVHFGRKLLDYVARQYRKHAERHLKTMLDERESDMSSHLLEYTSADPLISQRLISTRTGKGHICTAPNGTPKRHISPSSINRRRIAS